MALTGELSDLSLAELIEFFCNQRKTGRLKVVYVDGPGYFYLQSGSVVHARVGELRGIEAVYYALTLPNASFTFSPAFEPPEQTIHQPWASVVLEGLRRMDEGIVPINPFTHKPNHQEEVKDHKEDVKGEEALSKSNGDRPTEQKDGLEKASVNSNVRRVQENFVPQFVSEPQQGSRPWTLAAVVGAVALIVAVIGIPWGWYAHSKAAKLANESKALATESVQSAAPAAVSNEPSNETAKSSAAPGENGQPTASSEAADLAAKRQREARAKEQAKARETSTAAATTASTPKENTAAANQSAPKPQPSSTNPGKKVTVQVTYDENGRVTQASGGDATALRIARQKRFPAGKAGSATVTIPIN